MQLLGVVLTVLGVWLILAVPAALAAGRFLRVGGERGRAMPVQPVSDDSVRSTAA
jgi:hypothetical protein